MVRCLSPSFVTSSFPSVNKYTANEKISVQDRESCSLHVFLIQKNARAAKDLQVSETYCTNNGYVIIPEPNKVTVSLWGGETVENEAAATLLYLTRHIQPRFLSTIEHWSALHPGQNIVCFLSFFCITLTFAKQTLLYLFFWSVLGFSQIWNSHHWLWELFQNPDLIMVTPHSEKTDIKTDNPNCSIGLLLIICHLGGNVNQYPQGWWMLL